jgi:hypothetical protein
VPKTIFWSWQSDRLGKVNRHFLRGVIVDAIAQVAGESGLEERLEIDHDVKGTAGIASIPETILKKIDASSVFIADITPVAVTEGGKYIANPNVLIELGYAKKALGTERIILVWNGAWGGCRPEDLPFDLRHRRAPFLYNLSPEADRSGIEREATTLTRELSAAIAVSLGTIPEPETSSADRVQSRDGDPSVWFAPGAILRVNAGTSFGADQLAFDEGPRTYIRIIPSAWEGEFLTGAHGVRPDLLPLGDVSGLSWGRARGGVICYNVSRREGPNVVARTATQWFQRTGEIWGFDGKPFFEIDESRRGNSSELSSSMLAKIFEIPC